MSSETKNNKIMKQKTIHIFIYLFETEIIHETHTLRTENE